MKKLLLLLLVNYTVLMGQGEGMGLLLDPKLYVDRPSTVPLMRGDFDNLPPSASIKKFAPTPGNQGASSTCAGWASAYAARTILEAIINKWDKSAIDSNVFSPSFVYNQIRMADNCKHGTSLIDALDLIKNQGSLKLSDFEYSCGKSVTDEDKNKAGNYKIIEYRDVVPYSLKAKKIQFIKKSLAEQKPVIIAFDTPPSFMRARDVWNPDSSDYKDWSRGHAMVVVGYDDSKAGGAFEVINSWGTNWGSGGFAWIKYSDFDYFCHFAFEVINYSAPDPAKPDLSGSLKFTLDNGEPMQLNYNGAFFETVKAYPSGTLFELRLANNEPAYVYSFGTDLTYKTYKIFPFTDRMVPYLPYSRNNVAIPDEDSYNILDDNSGKSYYCFFYSKEKLDIEAIMKSFESLPGTVAERIHKLLEERAVNGENININTENGILFNAKSKGRSVIPLIVQINHTDY